MVTLVATDLDGTIVQNGTTMSPRTIRALQRVVEAGVRVVFVTGRPPRWLDGIADAAQHRGVAICANGALVYDLHAQAVTDQYLLDAATAQEAARRVLTMLPSAGFAVERADGFAHDPTYRPRWSSDETVVVPTEELLAQPLAKLLVRDETSMSDLMLASVQPALQGLVDVTHSNANDCLVEISAQGVSKAATLANLCGAWGIAPSDVVAFGDMPNDIDMLRWAGRGVAVANAHPDVLAVADEVTAGVEHDGVAMVLESLCSSLSGGIGIR